MAKLLLQAHPTFKAKVGIPIAGGAAVEVEFTFKHRTKTELQQFGERVVQQEGIFDAALLMDYVLGWDLADEFNTESVNLLLENYIGAPLLIWQTYANELTANKLKN